MSEDAKRGYVASVSDHLRSWQLFVAVAVLLLVDLLVPDPIFALDEIVLVALTYALSQWKKPPQ
ncbi:MAG: hypothetical protein Ct9H300mP25_17850 [Acidobacteriota bacterium]|nr:MAG: hypothetical protein Ct9H300mP25_17850 [Acidobacteriota bacterium]